MAIVLGLALVWFDRTAAQAGFWTLLILSVTLGLFHGALDARLLLQQFQPVSRALAMAGFYLLAVVVTGCAFSLAVDAALLALLAMTLWHFGEPYGRWPETGATSAVFTRIVVGGSAVMWPYCLAPQAVDGLLAPVFSASVLLIWKGSAFIWLGLAVFWFLRFGLRQPRTFQNVFYEILGSAVLNLLLTPLMAFAVYFGIYHSPVHIWRVLRKGSSGTPRHWWLGAAVIGITLAVTAVLSGVLWRFVAADAAVASGFAVGLRWLVVALAALTVPHLALISLCAPYLASKPTPDLRS